MRGTNKELIGITTTVPVETVFAAGAVPVDLNNLFITADKPEELIELAEGHEYPRNICAWIKGIYATLVRRPDIKTIITVVQGSCSNAHVFAEILSARGVRSIPFSFPHDRDPKALLCNIKKLASDLGASWPAVTQQKELLDEARSIAHAIDRDTWSANLISGFHNHLYQVTCSDFDGHPAHWIDRAICFRAHNALKPFEVPKLELRIGYIGVPPIISNLYSHLESRGARVVFNEVQRQFSMPAVDAQSAAQSTEVALVDSYLRYSYPYSITYRLQDIKRQIKLRKLDGIIHYVQNFCYHRLEDIIVRQQLDLPILTLEGDQPGELDARSKMRVNTFLDVLQENKEFLSS